MTGHEDSRLEAVLGRILRLGVTSSSIALAVGLVFTLTGLPAPGQILLEGGVLVLLATPAARVALSAVAYAVQRDWLFAGLVGLVFLELLAGLAAAFRASG